MALCDIVYQFFVAYSLLSLALPDISLYHIFGHSEVICIGKGIVEQFFQIASVSWNFILSIILFQIMYFETELNKIDENMKYCHCYVWSISSICTLINSLANEYVYQSPNMECWIKHSIFQFYTLYLIIIIYLIVAIVLLCYWVYIMYYSNEKIANLNKRIVYFTMVFVIVWIFPIINQLLLSIHYDINSPLFIVITWIHDIAVASVGLCNAIVWGRSNLWGKYRRYLIRQKRRRAKKSKITSLLASSHDPTLTPTTTLRDISVTDTYTKSLKSHNYSLN